MFFIFSKVLLFLLIPFWWLVILFVWMKFAKNPLLKKRLYYLLVFLFIVFTNPFLYRALVSNWQVNNSPLPKGKVYEAGIVLGGMAGYDKSKNGYFGGNADRFIQTANLYHQGIIKKIIVSGGTGSLSQDEPAEAIFLREQFMANGVRDSDIIIEKASRNTYENAFYSKKITDSLKLAPPYVLITSAIHMKRSVSTFQKQGFDCIPYSCDFEVVPKKNTIEYTLLPDITLLGQWGYFIKEVVGLYAYKLTGKA
ncbi:MAG: hypothetical protein RLZZ28_1994 [Bacteroidota bacterium]|jgi:uncharacterized SAM-binding protein YcdF (DUF218 family)